MLVILTTHPIQYQVPLWQALARDGRVPFEVWYLSDHATRRSHDWEFGKSFAWDLDMLSGYPHRFLRAAAGATPTNFWKCRFAGNLAELFRESRATAVWIQGWQVAGYWQAVWAAKRVGAEVWLRAESNDLAPTPWAKRIIKRVVLGQLFRRVDRFLCIGTANRRLYENYGVPKERLYSAPYAVDNQRFAEQAAALRLRRRELRRAWKIPDDAFCVLFCGKFIPKKRPMDVVGAAQLLITERRLANVHLLFAGSGDLGPELRRACHVVFDAESTGSQPSTGDSQLPSASFAGFLNQTEISKAYVAADCLVLPSDYGETWGLVVNEAMASGLPAIVSKLAGCADDLIVEGRTGFTFSLGDIAELADRIEELAALKASGFDFSRTFREKLAVYSIDSTAKAASRAAADLAEQNCICAFNPRAHEKILAREG